MDFMKLIVDSAKGTYKNWTYERCNIINMPESKFEHEYFESMLLKSVVSFESIKSDDGLALLWQDPLMSIILNLSKSQSVTPLTLSMR